MLEVSVIPFKSEYLKIYKPLSVYIFGRNINKSEQHPLCSIYFLIQKDAPHLPSVKAEGRQKEWFCRRTTHFLHVQLLCTPTHWDVCKCQRMTDVARQHLCAGNNPVCVWVGEKKKSTKNITAASSFLTYTLNDDSDSGHTPLFDSFHPVGKNSWRILLDHSVLSQSAGNQMADYSGPLFYIST